MQKLNALMAVATTLLLVFAGQARADFDLYKQAVDHTFYVAVSPSTKYGTEHHPVNYVCYKPDRSSDAMHDNKKRRQHWSMQATNEAFPDAQSGAVGEGGFHDSDRLCEGINSYIEVQLPIPYFKGERYEILARLKPCENMVRYAVVVDFDGPYNHNNPPGAKLLTACLEPWKLSGVPDEHWEGWTEVNTMVYAPGVLDHQQAADKTFRVAIDDSLFRRDHHNPHVECHADGKRVWKEYSVQPPSEKMFKSDKHLDKTKAKRCEGVVRVCLPKSGTPECVVVAELQPCTKKVRYALITEQSGGRDMANPPGTRLKTACIEPWKKGGIPGADWSEHKHQFIQSNWPGQPDVVR